MEAPTQSVASSGGRRPLGAINRDILLTQKKLPSSCQLTVHSGSWQDVQQALESAGFHVVLPTSLGKYFFDSMGGVIPKGIDRIARNTDPVCTL